MPRPFVFSNNLHEFAKQIVWFPCAAQEADDIDEFLLFLLANGNDRAIMHARRAFGVTNADFQRAIRKAEPGTFMYEKFWEERNKLIGIDPPPPFPRPARMLKVTDEKMKKEEIGAA